MPKHKNIANIDTNVSPAGASPGLSEESLERGSNLMGSEADCGLPLQSTNLELYNMFRKKRVGDYELFRLLITF